MRGQIERVPQIAERERDDGQRGRAVVSSTQQTSTLPRRRNRWLRIATARIRWKA